MNAAFLASVGCAGETWPPCAVGRTRVGSVVVGLEVVVVVACRRTPAVIAGEVGRNVEGSTGRWDAVEVSLLSSTGARVKGAVVRFCNRPSRAVLVASEGWVVVSVRLDSPAISETANEVVVAGKSEESGDSFLKSTC